MKYLKKNFVSPCKSVDMIFWHMICCRNTNKFTGLQKKAREQRKHEQMTIIKCHVFHTVLIFLYFRSSATSSSFNGRRLKKYKLKDGHAADWLNGENNNHFTPFFNLAGSCLFFAILFFFRIHFVSVFWAISVSWLYNSVRLVVGIPLSLSNMKFMQKPDDNPPEFLSFSWVSRLC